MDGDVSFSLVDVEKTDELSSEVLFLSYKGLVEEFKHTTEIFVT